MSEDVPMAWIVKIPPSPRHRRIRWQVRYQDGLHERSAGIYHTKPEAVAAKHAIERGEPPPTAAPQSDRATTLFGAYATQVWWPAWNRTHPRSAGTVKAKVNARILPIFGDLPLNQVDADHVSRWTHSLAADGLSPCSIRTYRALLGLILNAAVTDGYLPYAPTCRRRISAGRPARSSQVWLTQGQLHRLAEAIEPRYRALVLTAAHTGALVRAGHTAVGGLSTRPAPRRRRRGRARSPQAPTTSHQPRPDGNPNLRRRPAG
jgi:hypothetical protein